MVHLPCSVLVCLLAVLSSCTDGELAGPAVPDLALPDAAVADLPQTVDSTPERGTMDTSASDADTDSTTDLAGLSDGPRPDGPVPPDGPLPDATPADGPLPDLPAAADAPAGPAKLVVSQALQLDHGPVAPGGTISGSVSYTNVGGSAIAVPALVMAVEGPGGSPHVNAQPVLTQLTFAPGQTHSLTASHTLSTTAAAGSWTAFSSWRDSGGSWHPAPPVSFTVSATTPPDQGPPPADAAPPADGGVGKPDAGTVQPLGPAGSWTLVFHDEFDDSPGMSGPTNGLQASKWNSGWYSGPVSPGVGNVNAVTQPVQSKEIQYFGPAGIVFPGNGAVHLRLQPGVDSGGSFAGRTVESGQITTAGLLAFNPASVPVSSSSPDLRPYTLDGTAVLEVRTRFPGPHAVGAGSYWPVIWMTNAGNYSSGASPPGTSWPGGTPYSEEIDLIEFHGPYGSLGSVGRFHLHAASEYGGMSSVPASMQSADLSLACHTYTYRLAATSIQLWVDGVAVPAVAPTASEVAAQWLYPQYLMLAFQAVAGATYPTSASTTPSDMMIDYVRVWQ